MKKTLIILRHEFLVTVRRRSFLIITFAFPVLALLGLLAFQVVLARGPTTGAPQDVQRVGYVDNVGRFARHADRPGISLVAYPDEEKARMALLGGEIDKYFVIPANYMATGQIIKYVTRREGVFSREDAQDTEFLRDFLLANLLADEASAPLLERVKAPLQLTSLRLDEAGQVMEQEHELVAFGVPYLFGMLLAISIFASSGFLLQGVAEEKENRIIEVLLSSVSARQLLTGKVLGLGAVGLLQLLIWLVSARVLAQMASVNLAFLGTISIPTNLIAMGVIYFILGYLLFAITMAGAGSLGTTAREGQQLSGIFTWTAVIPLMFSGLIIMSPDHIGARILSVFPYTAPFTMMLRIAAFDIPVWEQALSIAVMVASVVVAMVLAAKVFRMGILMYGKRPGLREIARYIREA